MLAIIKAMSLLFLVEATVLQLHQQRQPMAKETLEALLVRYQETRQDNHQPKPLMELIILAPLLLDSRLRNKAGALTLSATTSLAQTTELAASGLGEASINVGVQGAVIVSMNHDSAHKRLYSFVCK